MNKFEKDPLMEMLGYKEVDDGFHDLPPINKLIELTNKEKELAHNRITYWMDQEPQREAIERDARKLGVNVDELRSLFHNFSYNEFERMFTYAYHILKVHIHKEIRPNIDYLMKICEGSIFNASYLRAFMTMRSLKEMETKKEGK